MTCAASSGPSFQKPIARPAMSEYQRLEAFVSAPNRSNILRRRQTANESTRGKRRQPNTGVLYENVSCSRTRASRIPRRHKVCFAPLSAAFRLTSSRRRVPRLDPRFRRDDMLAWPVAMQQLFRRVAIGQCNNALRECDIIRPVLIWKMTAATRRRVNCFGFLRSAIDRGFRLASRRVLLRETNHPVASFESSASTGQSLVVSHGWFMQ